MIQELLCRALHATMTQILGQIIARVVEILHSDVLSAIQLSVVFLPSATYVITADIYVIWSIGLQIIHLVRRGVDVSVYSQSQKLETKRWRQVIFLRDNFYFIFRFLYLTIHLQGSSEYYFLKVFQERFAPYFWETLTFETGFMCKFLQYAS